MKSHKSATIAGDVAAYLNAHEHKSILRLVACDSIDDEKRMLIGRLLDESRLILNEHLAVDAADFALPVDRVQAERGRAIDTGYHFFSTNRRKFMLAEPPGHEQYTCSMVMAASNADLAIILIDAGKGVLTSARRHSYIVSLLGVRNVVLAVDRMDQVEFSRDVFDRILGDYRECASQIDIGHLVAIPISALNGDNVMQAGPRMPWYHGPTLMEHLESVEIDPELRDRPFRMPVQWVNQTNQDFRGFAGMIVSGVVRKGDRVRVAPSGKESRVARIVTQEGDLDYGIAGQSVTLTVEHDIDVCRGDLLSAAESPAAVADQFRATIIWMHEQPMLPGRTYQVKIGTRATVATITSLKHKVDVNTLEHLAARTLELNEIGLCNVGFDSAVPFDPYAGDRETGGFILIDRFTNETVGAGLIQYALRRADNIHWQALDVDKTARARVMGQKSCALWFTGLSGAGKSTIANLLEKRLLSIGKHTYLLDGDNVRHGLNRDLGFTDADRVENIRRVAEVMRLMVDAGLIVLVSFISPFRSERRMARNLLEEGQFIEVFVDTPLAEAEKRDTKGLYSKARRGELKHFTGIDSPYEEPEHPEIHVDTVNTTASVAVELIVEWLVSAGVLGTGSEC